MSFLGFTSLFKEIGLRYKGNLDFYDLFLIGSLVGVLNTIIIMPADFLKTHLQKFKEKGVRVLGC